MEWAAPQRLTDAQAREWPYLVDVPTEGTTKARVADLLSGERSDTEST